MNFYKKSGFALVEILIVIGILTILSIALIFALNPGQAGKKARDLKRQKDIASTYEEILEYDQSTGGKLPLQGRDPGPLTGPLAGAYFIAAFSNNAYAGTQGYYSWDNFQDEIGSILPRDPRNSTNPSNYSVYYYQIITYDDGNPRYAYYNLATCISSLNGPGIPYRGFIYAIYLDNSIGNYYDDFLSRCGQYDPDIYRTLFNRIQIRLIE